MAARTRRIKHDEKTKAKIKTSQLVNRIQNYGLANLTDADFARKAMQPAQVKAVLGLLAKVMPDLQRTQLEGGDADKPLRVARELSDDELAQLAAGGLPKSKRK